MIRPILILITGLLLTVAASCVGMHGNSTLDAIQGAITESKPIVEAYIEYPGPQERWAGPSTVAIHVTARDGVEPTIAVTPHVFQDGDLGVTRKGSLSTQTVRERLALVATALSQNVNSGDDKAGGCLSPVRARLIKSDGQVIEKRGCRSQTGWVFQAADAATDLLAAAENGTREPASSVVAGHASMVEDAAKVEVPAAAKVEPAPAKVEPAKAEPAHDAKPAAH